MLFVKELTLCLRIDNALGQSLSWMGAFYCQHPSNNRQLCLIHVLISFTFEFKAVSPRRTLYFGIAAKIYGDSASWLEVGVVVFSTQNMFSVSGGAFENCVTEPWAVSALSALLREGCRWQPGGETGAMLPQRHLCPRHTEVPGELGRHPQPLGRTHQMAFGLWLCSWPAGSRQSPGGIGGELA